MTERQLAELLAGSPEEADRFAAILTASPWEKEGYTDETLTSVRAVREAMYRQAGGTPQAYFAHVRSLEPGTTDQEPSRDAA